MKGLYVSAAIAAVCIVPGADSGQIDLDGRSFVVRPDAVVHLRDIPGPVYVTTGTSRSVLLRIVRTAAAPVSDPSDVRVEHSPDRIAIVGRPSEDEDPDARRSQVHLVVPPDVRLDVRNLRGELRVDGVIRGAVSMVAVAGRVHLQEVSSSLTLLRIGGAVFAGLTGSQPVHIAQVSGSVALTLDTVGEVLVSPASSSVRIRASSEPQVERRVSVQVFAFRREGRRVEIDDVAGSIEINVTK